MVSAPILTPPDDLKLTPDLRMKGMGDPRALAGRSHTARNTRLSPKAKVEVGVQVVQRWILARLRNRRFSLWPS